MTAAIVDASAVLAWLLPSQATAASRAFQPRIRRIVLEAPLVFEWEVQNVLLRVVGRPSRSGLYEAALEQLVELDVALGAMFPPTAVMALARAEGLSLFDACYLDRALRRDVPLISRDKALVTAALGRGVTVHDLT